MSEVQRYTESDGEGGGVAPSRIGEFVEWKDYAALVAQRDEGLAREAALRRRNCRLDERLREEQTYVSELAAENTELLEKYEAARDRKNSITFLQQRLAEAKKLFEDIEKDDDMPGHYFKRRISAWLEAIAVCVDQDKP